MKIIVIGGGASGLTAAAIAAENGAEVTVLEGREKPAGKLYATGNGRCNLTNTEMSDRYYRSADTALIKKTIKRFGYQDTLEFFHSLGLMFKNKNGYIYPSTGQAATVAELLVKRCRELGVNIQCASMVVSLKKRKDGKFIIKYIQSNHINRNNSYRNTIQSNNNWQNNINQKNISQNNRNIKTSNQKNVSLETTNTKETQETADKVILAAGSSAGGFGCEVTGTELAKAAGHTIIPLVPALTGLKCENKQFFQTAAGVRIDAKITLCQGENEQVIAEEAGELQLTDYGISGIPVFQISRFAGYGLLQKQKIIVQIDFLPEYDFGMLLGELNNSRKLYKNRSILEVFSFIFHAKLVKAVLLFAGIKESRKISELSDREQKNLLYCFKRFSVKVTGINEIKHAQVCAGGVHTAELTDDFMSKKTENLYITGETVDVDGICGGYNLQFAWASGYLAGKAASWKKEKNIIKKE